jgi:holo-[acyl-carrier protein] synthase
MLRGIGLDIIETSRIETAMRHHRFLSRIFTPRERESLGSPETVAGRWAAKEAVAKAVGKHLRWHDVEILKDAMGKPVVIGSLPNGKVHVSITHDGGVAAAVAIWEAD